MKRQVEEMQILSLIAYYLSILSPCLNFTKLELGKVKEWKEGSKEGGKKGKKKRREGDKKGEEEIDEK